VSDSDTIGVVELIVSELTANVVKHAGGSATLRLQRLDGVVRVEVRDTQVSQVPRKRSPDLEDPSGRGLLLVSSLASSWGYDRSEGQKCTWAEVDLPGDSAKGSDPAE
jgi:anti-sigma regulatory factor (Ser/Thr protein kinase)